MLPVRAPIQVTLDETGGRQVHCTRRAGQVKILRRPPIAAKQQPPAGPSAIPTTHTRPLERRLFPEPSQDSWSEPDHEWPQLQPASQHQQPQPAPKKPEKLYSAIHTKSQPPHKSAAATTLNNLPAPTLPLPPPPTSHPNNHRHPPPPPTAQPNKPPLKTYQERADEYAKARLRILGSAFPDDHQHDAGHHSDVNRLLDPASLLSTDTPGCAIASPAFNTTGDNNNCTRSTNKLAANNFYPDSNRARQSR